MEGNSIYGPNEVWWCEHPKNVEGNCSNCPRVKMTADELISDLNISAYAAREFVRMVLGNTKSWLRNPNLPEYATKEYILEIIEKAEKAMNGVLDDMTPDEEVSQ